MPTNARVGVWLVAAGMAIPASGGSASGGGQGQLPDLRSQNIAVIAVSPDGRRVATGERSALVKLWDAQTRELQRTLKAHAAPVSSLAFSPDGRLLATGSFDPWIRLWDVQSARSILELGGHPGHVKSLAFSGDGALLASAGADGVRVWDLASGSLRSVLPSPRGVVAAAFSPDRTALASAGGDGMRLWDVATGTLTRSFGAGAGELVLALAFSPDGRWLASGGTGRRAKLWDAKAGTLSRRSERGRDFVRALAFSRDGSTVVVADRTGTRLWNTGTGAMKSTLDDTRFTVVALSSDGRALGAAKGDAAVEVLMIAAPPSGPPTSPPPLEAQGDAAFERTVRPVLFRTCTPCHAPGGRMYGRMPFDSPAVVRDHRAGILRRLKGDDRAAIEAWLASGS